MGSPDWAAARLAASTGDIEGVERCLPASVLAEGKWWLVQLARSDRAALALAELLLRHGAPVDRADDMGSQALHLCAKFPSVLARLLAAGADVNVPNQRGHTPLMMAADTGPVAAVRTLLAAGANVNAAAVDGGTGLLFACDHGKRDCIEALLDAGAMPNIADQRGRTPLKLANQTIPDETDLLARLRKRPGATTRRRTP